MQKNRCRQTRQRTSRVAVPSGSRCERCVCKSVEPHAGQRGRSMATTGNRSRGVRSRFMVHPSVGGRTVGSAPTADGKTDRQRVGEVPFAHLEPTGVKNAGAQREHFRGTTTTIGRAPYRGFLPLVGVTSGSDYSRRSTPVAPVGRFSRQGGILRRGCAGWVSRCCTVLRCLPGPTRRTLAGSLRCRPSRQSRAIPSASRRRGISPVP